MPHHTKKAKRKSSVNWRTGPLVDPTPEVNEEQPSVDEQIRVRAYELHMERDGQPNDELGDWLQAERELSEGPMPEALLGEHRETES
jgi:hypothetical protein